MSLGALLAKNKLNDEWYVVLNVYTFTVSLDSERFFVLSYSACPCHPNMIIENFLDG